MAEQLAAKKNKPKPTWEDMFGDDSDADTSSSTSTTTQQKVVTNQSTTSGGAATVTETQTQRIYGENPFRISFTHQSSAGYCGHSLADGYSNNNTEIKVNQSISLKNLFITLDGAYQDIGNGLQSKAESVSSVNQDTVFGKGNILWTLPKGFFVNGSVDSEFYNRFA